MKTNNSASIILGLYLFACTISGVALAADPKGQKEAIPEDVSEIPRLVNELHKERVWSVVKHRAYERTDGIKAARTLRKIIEKAGAEHLEKWLEHDNWIVRANLTWVLNGNTSSAAIKLLQSMAKDKNATVRVLAIRELAASSDRAAVDTMMEALDDPESKVRTAAAYGLEVAKSCSNYRKNDVVNALSEAVDDENPDVRVGIAESLGEIQDSNALPALMELLEDKQRLVRHYAATALGDIKDRRSTVALITALRKEKDEENNSKIAIVRALGELEDTRAVSALISQLESTDENVRKASAKALGEIRDRRAVPSLLKSLDDKSIEVRGKAAYSLGEIGSMRALEPLISVLKDQKLADAATALGKLNHPEAIRPLIEVLFEEGDKKSHVQKAAAEALENIRHPDVVVQLVKATLKHSGYAGHIARRALEHKTDWGFAFDPPKKIRRWWGAHKDEFKTDEPSKKE